MARRDNPPATTTPVRKRRKAGDSHGEGAPSGRGRRPPESPRNEGKGGQARKGAVQRNQLPAGSNLDREQRLLAGSSSGRASTTARSIATSPGSAGPSAASAPGGSPPLRTRPGSRPPRASAAGAAGSPARPRRRPASRARRPLRRSRHRLATRPAGGLVEERVLVEVGVAASRSAGEPSPKIAWTTARRPRPGRGRSPGRSGGSTPAGTGTGAP